MEAIPQPRALQPTHNSWVQPSHPCAAVCRQAGRARSPAQRSALRQGREGAVQCCPRHEMAVRVCWHSTLGQMPMQWGLDVQSRMRTRVRMTPARACMEMGLREHTHAPITSCVAVVLGSARMATEASGTVREGRVLLWSVGWTHRADGWAVAAAAVERGQVAVGCGW